jgi:hypothetical protein
MSHRAGLKVAILSTTCLLPLEAVAEAAHASKSNQKHHVQTQSPDAATGAEAGHSSRIIEKDGDYKGSHDSREKVFNTLSDMLKLMEVDEKSEVRDALLKLAKLKVKADHYYEKVARYQSDASIEDKIVSVHLKVDSHLRSILESQDNFEEVVGSMSRLLQQMNSLKTDYSTSEEISEAFDKLKNLRSKAVDIHKQMSSHHPHRGEAWEKIKNTYDEVENHLKKVKKAISDKGIGDKEIGERHTKGVEKVGKSGSQAQIDTHGVCKVVTNENGKPMFVPTYSADEWSKGDRSFLKNIPEKARVEDCNRGRVSGTPTPTPAYKGDKDDDDSETLRIVDMDTGRTYFVKRDDGARWNGGHAFNEANAKDRFDRGTVYYMGGEYHTTSKDAEKGYYSSKSSKSSSKKDDDGNKSFSKLKDTVSKAVKSVGNAIKKALGIDD